MPMIHDVSHTFTSPVVQKSVCEETASSWGCTWKQDKKTQAKTKFRWDKLACKAKGVLILNLNLHCYWNKFNGLLQHIFLSKHLSARADVQQYCSWHSALAKHRNACDSYSDITSSFLEKLLPSHNSRKENWSGFLSLSGRESCVLQTPYAGSRVFQLSQGRLPLSCSILAFCWTKGSWTSMSHWSSADQCSSRAASSSWKNG